MTTATMTLADFLLARIAEDEAGARQMIENENWRADCNEPHDARVQIGDWTFDGPRVLAECEAKRQIVNAESRWRRTKDNVTETAMTKAPDEWVNVSWFDDDDHQPHHERMSQAEFRERFTEPALPSETLKLIALPYAAHPDYRSEWRP